MSARTDRLEQEIEQTRNEMDDTIDELGDRLSLHSLTERGKELLKERAPHAPEAGPRMYQRRPTLLGAVALGMGIAAGFFLSPVRSRTPEQRLVQERGGASGSKHVLPQTRAEREMEERAPEAGRPVAQTGPGGQRPAARSEARVVPPTRAEREMEGNAVDERPTEPSRVRSGQPGPAERTAKAVPSEVTERRHEPVSPERRPERPPEGGGAPAPKPAGQPQERTGTGRVSQPEREMRRPDPDLPAGRREPGQAERRTAAAGGMPPLTSSNPREPEAQRGGEPRPPNEAGAQQGPNPQRKEEPKDRPRSP